MRKSMVVFVVLLAAGIGGMCFAHSTLSAAQDNVSFAEVEAFGDVSAADGLTVSVRTHLDYHLFWDTAHTFEQTPMTHTNFSFHPSQLYRAPEFASPPLSLSIPLDFNASTSGGNLLGVGEGSAAINQTEFTVIYDMLRDVAVRTQNGEQRTETLYIRDYFGYYPISVYIDAEQYYYVKQDEAEANEAFSNFFRFPVPEGRTLTVTIRKDGAGNVVEIGTGRVILGYTYGSSATSGSSAASGSGSSVVSGSGSSVVSDEDIVSIYAIGVETEKGIYFAIVSEGITDFTGIPGGFGIFLLPTSTIIGEPDAEYHPTLDCRNIQTAYPLGDSTTIHSLTLSEDGSCLNLITYEDGGCFLTVIELETMVEKQKMPLFEDMRDTFLYTANFVGELLYAALSDNRFMLAERGAGNTYRPVLTGARDYLLSFEDYIDWNDPQIAWNGERLALVSRYRRSLAVSADDFRYASVEACGFTLEIYDDSGLSYKGAFESSLDVLDISDMAYDICRPTDTDGLSARW